MVYRPRQGHHRVIRVTMLGRLLLIIVSILPLIGSRAVNNGLLFDQLQNSPSGHSPGPPAPLSLGDIENNPSESLNLNEDGHGSNPNVNENSEDNNYNVNFKSGSSVSGGGGSSSSSSISSGDTSVKEEAEGRGDGGGGGGEGESVSGNNGNNINSSAACSLVPLTFDEKDSSGATLLSYDDKFLIHVSHPVFQVSQGIVPTIIYQVTVEIPSGHEFSLEYWVNGLTEERSRLKRRHQRDRREVLELFPSPSNADQVVFCSKNSLGGLNQDSTLKLFTFNFFLTTHPTVASAPSNAINNQPSFPTTLIFRLRFRSIVEATSSVFEQNLSISVRPNCQLRVNVGERMKLTLNSLWNTQMENTGLNCTILIRPKFGFGFELRLTNLSIYGIRDLCKGRYLSLASTSSSSPKSSPNNSPYPGFKSFNNNLPLPRADSYSPKFAEKPPSSSSWAIHRKFCGKIEDYSLEERSLTFSSKYSKAFFSSEQRRDMQESPSPQNQNQHRNQMELDEAEDTAYDEESPDDYSSGSSSSSSSRSRSSKEGKNDKNTSESEMQLPEAALSLNSYDNSNYNEYNSGLLLSVSLPAAVKLKETFAVELLPLSPCQKVHLTELAGELKYFKNYDSDECSIIIHVPYGNTIMTQLTFENSVTTSSSNNNNNNNIGNESLVSDIVIDGESTARTSLPSQSSGGSVSSSTNGTVMGMVNSNMDEATHSTVVEGEGAETGDDDCDTESETVMVKNNNKFLIQAQDLVSGKKFTWCFTGVDVRGSEVYKRAWKSAGNHVRITFNLQYFHHFTLAYEAIKIPEITGNCERGWVTVDYGCVQLVERAETWGSGEEDCQTRGGHLVTVRDDLSEKKIQKLIVESALFHPSRAYWIGANDRESEGNFQWTSGLPFIYTNWFPGWVHKTNGIVNAQPNDDGFSGQDCVELRGSFSSHSAQQEKNFEMNNIHVKGSNDPLSYPPEGASGKFHWNDRNCETKNFYLCEKTTHKNWDFSCNQTLRILPGQMTPLSVTSPAYPSSYPDNVICVTTVETTPGYRLYVQFEEFSLEESPSCKYDSLEMYETSEAGEILHRGNGSSGGGGGGPEERAGLRMGSFGSVSHYEFPLERDKDKLLQRICGNWNKRLKLLRYTTSLTATQLHFKFESDFSHHFPGFKAKVSAEIVKGWLSEKEKDEQCVDSHMQRFGSSCYLFVSFPPVGWNQAFQTCLSMKGNLVSVLSLEEWNFLTRNLMSAPHYDKKSIYWLGGFIDQSSQLVWMDRMPFNFSAFHPSDLQTISNWKCLSLYWHEGGKGKGDFAWRLSECNQLSGYICKKNTQVETKHGFNRTFSGTGGKLSSPNFPASYYNNLNYLNHLVAPNGTQIVVRFNHLDVETQEDCLYDYVEIIDRRTRNMTRYCGTHHKDNLDKLNYVSSSNEVDIVFHTDFADTFTGFEIVWRAVDVSGCIAGKTILTGIGSGFPLHDATIFTPNFPYFNLPGLNCVYTIVAPAGQRIWLSFQVLEIGTNPSASTNKISTMEEDCSQQDRVLIDLGSDDHSSDSSSASSQSSSSTSEILLCGNLTAAPHRTSFVSYREKLTIRVFSPKGKSGRGFLGTFKAIPMGLNEVVAVNTRPNSSFSLTSLNYPLVPPKAVNFTLSLTSPPNYVLTIRVQGKSYPKCQYGVSSFMEISDPLAGANGSRYFICQPDETSLTSLFALENNENDNKIATQNVPGLDSTYTFRSAFNRLDIKQVYVWGAKGRKWNAEVITSWDENFRTKIMTATDRILLLKACNPNPCLNGGKCASDGGRHICRCPAPYTGPFCGLSQCDLNPCLFGDCFIEDKSFRCACQLGYGGERCDRRKKPCDERPCTGHGDCIEIPNSTYRCVCHAYWEGPRCEAKMIHIPYRPLSQRMLKEPFWLGMITVTVVLGVIGLVWCLKRHFPEKLDKLLNDDLDRNRGISWVSGRSPSSIRIGSGGGVGLREPVAGTSAQSTSPPTSRSFLGRFGIRKPSLLSLSSATSAVSVTASSPHQYENRTFSLDDLLRPTRSMMRTPSPHRRRNYSIQVRRDPNEKQQILQQLVSSGGSQSLDGEVKPSTPKPTIAEIIQMSEKRLRLASASSVTSDTTGGDTKKQSSLEGEVETSFSNPAPSSSSMMLTPTSKAEKKVTFARLLDKLAATEMSSSSSCSDVSCAEDKTVVVIKPPERKKERKGRFRRSKSYNRGRSSETDQDVVEMSSSDTTPDPICPPRFPTRLCISPTGASSPNNTPSISISASSSSNGNKLQASKSLTKMASADSLLALFRRFSGSSSAPPSPQYSENEESSAGATPLSTPSSPRNSTLSIRPPAFLITSVEQSNNTIELPVIDPFSQPGWRTGQSSSITLEVPMRDYCLSPIHEVPTPLPTPSHSPAHTPMMHRPRQQQPDPPVPLIKVLISSEDEGVKNNENDPMSPRSPPRQRPPPKIKFPLPIIAISVDGEDDDDDPLDNDDNDSETNALTGDTEVIPDVLIHVPPEVSLESKPEPMEQQQGTAFIFPTSPTRPPRLKREKFKPPPLIFANEILSYTDPPSSKEVDHGSSIAIPVPAVGPGKEYQMKPDQKNEVAVPALNIEYAAPPMMGELLPPKFSNPVVNSPVVYCQISAKPWDSNLYPLVPPVITINQSSEAESDSDTPVVRKLIRRPNLTFLSPFVGSSDRVPSESNLSTSGYSSMASPCPSRCPSVSPLCPSEAEDNYHCSHHHGGGPGPPYIRRSSLTPATPRKSSLTQRRCSLNATSPLVSMTRDSTMIFSEKYEQEHSLQMKSKICEGFETDSAVEIEAETDLESQPLTPGFGPPGSGGGVCDTIMEEMKVDLLQVPRKNMPKSRSLDMNAGTGAEGGQGGRKHQLKGDSLDSKLNSVDPITGSQNFTKFIESAVVSASILEMPEESASERKRLSPVSSRSDSPISELSVVGPGITSPLTDSDGIYDCPSSEVPNGNNNPPAFQQTQIRRSGRRRDRRLSASSTHKKNEGYGMSLQVNYGSAGPSPSKSEIQSMSLNLDPSLSKESIVVPSASTSGGGGGHGLRGKSPKRRVRASSFIPSTSSSSAESLNSPRSYASTSSPVIMGKPGSNNSSSVFPLPPFELGSSELKTCTKSPTSLTGSTSLSCENLTKSISPKDADGRSLGEDDLAKDSNQPAATVKKEPTSTGGKISKLRAISHQIRFLRRLELSLLRKKECLSGAPGNLERRDSLLSSSDSCDSRCDTSETHSSQSESFIMLAENEKPLISLSSVSSIAARRRKRKARIIPSSLAEVNSITSDLLVAHKSRVRQYK